MGFSLTPDSCAGSATAITPADIFINIMVSKMLPGIVVTGDYLLLESGDRMLTEDRFYLLLE